MSLSDIDVNSYVHIVKMLDYIFNMAVRTRIAMPAGIVKQDFSSVRLTGRGASSQSVIRMIMSRRMR
jgi:hypothetical protein